MRFRSVSRPRSRPSDGTRALLWAPTLKERAAVPEFKTQEQTESYRGGRAVSLEDWKALNDLVHEFAYRVDFGPMGSANVPYERKSCVTWFELSA